MGAAPAGGVLPAAPAPVICAPMPSLNNQVSKGKRPRSRGKRGHNKSKMKTLVTLPIKIVGASAATPQHLAGAQMQGQRSYAAAVAGPGIQQGILPLGSPASKRKRDIE